MILSALINIFFSRLGPKFQILRFEFHGMRRLSILGTRSQVTTFKSAVTLDHGQTKER